MSSNFKRGQVTNFRAFKLPLVRGVSLRTKEWACYVNILCLVGPVSYLLTQHQEGGLPQEGFRSSSTLHISLAAPDKDHWSIYEDKKSVRSLQHLTNKCQKRQEKAEAERAEEEGNKQEKEEEDAPTNTDLPGMEVNNDGEVPNPEEVPPCSNSTSKPLECMLRDMDLRPRMEI